MQEEGKSILFFKSFGETPLHIALSYREFEIAKVLIEAGADVTAKDE